MMVYKNTLVSLVVILFGLINACVGEFVQYGQCNELVGVQINAEEISGDWILVRRLSKSDINDCVTLSVNETEDDNIVSLKSQGVLDNFHVEQNGLLTILPNSTQLQFKWEGNDEVLDTLVLSAVFNIFALITTCRPLSNNTRGVIVWQLNRPDAQITTSVINNINATLTRELGIYIDNLEELDHSEYACYELPEIPAGQPVIVPLLCNENIPIVENFDIAEFLGPWHEISSYYSGITIGTCARSEYSLTDGKLNVMNSEVVNQTLLTMSGNASIIGENNSGKLHVILEVTPGEYVSKDLLLLATDYTAYAIFYSCVPLSANESRVYSWILGRSPIFSDATQEAVRRVINSQLDLNNAYYQETLRSDDDCFYYPEPDPGQPVIFRGRCDESVAVMSDFRAEDYLGLWHNIESYSSRYQSGTCSNAYYSSGADSGISVFNTQVINQTLDTINGIAVVPDPNEPAKLVVSFPVDSTGETVSTDYWVLDTDYENYALVYTCINIEDNQRNVLSWKLSRTKSLSEAALQNITQKINSIPVLDEIYYENMNQSEEGCFYFPEPVPGKPVVFPGQCDDDISLPNFNLTSFIGTWYEIEAYPIDQRVGHCINHEYTTGEDNSLFMQSERIDDYRLYSEHAVVTADELDSGRLTITIRTADDETITLPFWIISTDYENYALAYSCVNKNSDFRNIYSWKLSRSKELSADSNDAIDEAISDIVVLENHYYEPIDQSNDACFYLPDLEPGEPIILVGQCDPNIPVVPNFNADNFLNRWRLIESYPSDSQTGTCNDATYTLLPDGTINVYNTEVLNETLNTVNGSAYFIDSGKLLVNYLGDSDPVEYWILDTDYTSYALVYSCVNVTSESRRVWSWKLSRDKFLSDEAISSIDSVMSNINVLHNRYFQNISHTSNDCFYFPEITEEPVLFRGQCDETIPVVPNFDPVRYNGKWYAIQSYPQELQYGKCLTAEHTLDEERGIVNIQNTQVFQERQNLINATATLDDDNSAKLTVTLSLPEFEIVTPYWILDTDYENYALVYSCVNYNDEYMRVGTWQLSRNRTLAPESTDAIQDITNNMKILDDRYLIVWGHDDDDCFFYPDLTDGRVILDGQCEDNNITVVSGFDPNQFRGVWYELERFPSEIQTGECSSTDFSLDTRNRFTVTQNIIHNERLSTYTGPAVVAEDGSGIITIDLNSDSGDSLNMNLYILDVKYDEFALVYSCRNINEEQKQVFSWKLGRYQSELSQDTTDRIDYIVSHTRDLYAGYYEQTKYSADACFYYPRFDELPNYITLPGLCDERIRGISDFDVNRVSDYNPLCDNYLRKRAIMNGPDNIKSYNNDTAIKV